MPRPGQGPLSPVARGELELQLAVLAPSQLLNGRILARVEARAARVDLAQDGEGQAQDHEIGRDRRMAIEAKGISPVAVAGDRGHAHPELYGSAEMLGDPDRELLVAAANMITSLRFPEDVNPSPASVCLFAPSR